MNIRDFFDFNTPYKQINREERNLCAILYHLLLINNNIEKFFTYLKLPVSELQNWSIYFEYSYLRDIWNEITDEQKKREYILKSLKYPKNHMLYNSSIKDFNEYFVGGNSSSTKIQYPGKWSISKYHKNIQNNNEFINVTIFKWCFNAKPDIVFHYGNNKAVCIEAKLESDIGTYPTSLNDKNIFKERDEKYVKQTEVQVELFKLLGLDCSFFILCPSLKESLDSKLHEQIKWSEVFSILDLNGVKDYISENRYIKCN